MTLVPIFGPQGEILIVQAEVRYSQNVPWFGPQGEILLVRYSPDQPRDDHGRFGSGSAPKTEEALEAHYSAKYPEVKEGAKVDGRTVTEGVDNMSSIGASLTNYLILDGVREVNFDEFDMPPDVTARTKELAEEIKQSGEIMPLIVGVDSLTKGPFIMEGSHRYDALKILGAKSIPAIVVLDLDELQKREERFDPNQARDPNGEFAHGSGETEKAAPQDKWKMAAGSREEFDRAVANTPGAKYTDKGLELDLSRYQPAEQAGAEAIRTGVFFLPELNSPYKSSYSTGKNGYGGGDKIEGRKEYLNPILTKGATGGKAPEKAYDMLKGKGAYEAMRSDVLNKVIGWNQSTSQKIDATREVLAKYGGKSDMASEIVQRSTQGNQLPYAIQEHIVACAVREAGHDAVISYSKSKGAERLSEVFDVNMSEYPSESFRSYLALLEFRFNADQPRDKDGKFTMGNVASFTNEKDGVSAHVTSYNGRLHVTLVDDDSKNVIGSSIFSGEGMKDKAIEKAQKLAGVKTKAEKRYSEDQPRDPDGKFAGGGDVYTLAGAKELVGKLGDGVTIIGSVATKGESKHDLDLLAASKETAEAARVKLEGLGYEWMGNSTLSPKEAAAYKGTKTFEKGKWSVMDEYTHTDTGKHVEVWHTEAADEERSLRFDADQPRDPDGKFASGGGDLGKKEPLEMLNATMSTHEARSAIIRNRARELNFPVERVKTEEGVGKEFKVGEHSFREAGHAEIYTTGNIVCYTGSNVQDSNLGGLVAHEVEHIRFQGVLNDYNNDMKVINGWASTNHEQYDAVTTPKGYVDPDKAFSFPAAGQLNQYLEEHIDQLEKEDGVSEYSKTYWAVLHTDATNGMFKEWRERAVHETLAEIARMKFAPEAAEKGDTKPSKMWTQLFQAVNRIAKKQGYGY